MKLVNENLNSFIRNQDPVKSLGLGYEGKIRSFFRSFDVLDKDYEVKKNGEIVFNSGLYLGNSQIRELPTNLTVKGWFDLRNTQIRELPANLTVKGWLDLSNTQIRELPDNLTVKYSIYVSKDQTELINSINTTKFKNFLILS
jgi:hypothetical protein